MTARRALRVLAAVALLFSSVAAAQDTGRVAGRVINGHSGAPLSGAQVTVTGTQLRAVTAIDGRYSLAVPAGTHTVTASLLGFGPKSVSGVAVQTGRATTVDVSLTGEALQVEGITVSAASERGSVNRALDAQRTATGVVNSVTAEQMSRAPDSDAAAAVQRVSGVSVQDGRFVFVRGLGERYTTTSLNGARIPSPEPEKKVVPLDLFPSGVLQTVTTSKTFTPDQPGDFSGAQVNIRTREYPTRPTMTFAASTGLNSRATGRTVYSAPMAGLEWLALGEGGRSTPTGITEGLPSSPSPTQVNGIINDFRNVWSARARDGRPNTSLAMTAGGSADVLSRRIGYIGSATYSYNQEVRENEVRAYALPDGSGGTQAIDRFTGSLGRESVLWGGILNLSTLVGSGSRISLNNTYNRSADNEARRETGFAENQGLALRVDRLGYVERSVRSNQLAVEHEIGSRSHIDWSLTSSGVSRNEPDRSEVVYALGEAGDAPELLVDPEAVVRTFGTLSESAEEAGANYRLTFGDVAREHSVKVGGLFRQTRRESDNNAYSILTSLSPAERRLEPEAIFGGQFSTGAQTRFSIVPTNRGGSYAADDRLIAGYLMGEYAPLEWLTVVGGARVERSEVSLDAENTLGGQAHVEPAYTDVLPSLAANIRIGDRQNLRFSASQTLSRPEYRELAPIAYRDVIGGESYVGNSDLIRTRIQNFDTRWEWYPARGELVSVALFGKRFQDPIERVYLGTSGTRVVTFVNAQAATNYGVELEARKSLDELLPITGIEISGNATFMESSIEVDGDDVRQSGANRSMVGQAPYVANVALSYTTAGDRLTATALYNSIGARLYGAAENPLPEVIEEARSGVDLSLRYALTGSIGAKLDLRNLLDQPYRITQGSVTRQEYRTGRVVTVGLSLKR